MVRPSCNLLPSYFIYSNFCYHFILLRLKVELKESMKYSQQLGLCNKTDFLYIEREIQQTENLS